MAPCDLERDFVQTITDVGVCYTFNSAKSHSRKTVKDYGTCDVMFCIHFYIALVHEICAYFLSKTFQALPMACG